MSDEIDSIEAKLEKLRARNRDLNDGVLNSEINRLTIAKQDAEKRQLEASIRRRAKLNKGRR